MRDTLLVKQVQALYKLGHSVADISNILGKSSSNVSRWCRKASDGNLDRIPSAQDKMRQRWFDFDKISIENLDIDNCRLLVSILYWCEGAKYPSTGVLAFTSSDEKMQKVFIKLLRKAYPEEVEERKFHVVLQIPVGYNIEEIKEYWSKILNISTS